MRRLSRAATARTTRRSPLAPSTVVSSVFLRHEANRTAPGMGWDDEMGARHVARRGAEGERTHLNLETRPWGGRAAVSKNGAGSGGAERLEWATRACRYEPRAVGIPSKSWIAVDWLDTPSNLSRRADCI